MFSNLRAKTHRGRGGIFFPHHSGCKHNFFCFFRSKRNVKSINTTIGFFLEIDEVRTFSLMELKHFIHSGVLKINPNE